MNIFTGLDIYDAMLYLAFGVVAVLGLVLALLGWRASRSNDRRRRHRRLE